MFMYAFIHAERRRRGMDGHFPNSPEWAEEYLPEILGQFRGGVGPQDDRVSIHVRRGDYLHKQGIGALPVGYFLKAIALFPGARFLLFCRDRQGGAQDFEDREWFRLQFQSVPYDLWNGENEYDDMNMMASCQHNIIANSTFSLWAAMLNLNPHKRIVAPKVWDRSGWAPKMPTEWTKL
jgi:hypothetical protein